MRRLATTAALVSLLVLAGCGSGAKKAADDTTTTSSTTTSSSTTTTTTKPCVFAGTLEPLHNELASVDQLLTDVTTSTDGCVDSVTFTFRPSAAPAPSYQIEYATGPFLNSAGEAVSPLGAAFLKIRFQPAWIADLSIESVPLTYTGPRLITPTGLKAVRGVAMFDATEAVVGWVIGLDELRQYTVEATAGKVVVKIG